MTVMNNAMLDDDLIMEDIQRIRFENLRNEDEIVRFIPNEKVLRMYEEEIRRNNRQDARFDEEIAKCERTIEINANINMIINNLSELAASASNMATSNIDWSPNISF
jgi:uncharacterized protein YpuA (DUF1002 family)